MSLSPKPFASINPATRQIIWTGHFADLDEIEQKIQQGRTAFETWKRTPLNERISALLRFSEELKNHHKELQQLISDEAGKPLWESATEVNAMIGKVVLSIEAHELRNATFSSGNSITRFKPHGLVVVLGPFNFPGHLPNGHICPALLAGNTVLFKPSEHTPAVAEKMVDLWHKAGLPPLCLQLIHGDAKVAQEIIRHPKINGVYFTGSAQAGIAINQLLADQPQKILALEMGGNNPLIVDEVADLDAASLIIILSAYISAGQRCTCARRLIVTSKLSHRLVPVLKKWIQRIRVGLPQDRPEPFMASLIHRTAADKVLAFQDQLMHQGAQPIVFCREFERHSAILYPGLVDCRGVKNIPDEECFGPLLQFHSTPDFDSAIELANQTRFGLAAGLISDNSNKYQQFYDQINAGIVNYNQPLTGASSAAPFGGIGHSGNHRPSAFFAADYCSFPVASLESNSISLPPNLPTGIEPG